MGPPSDWWQGHLRDYLSRHRQRLISRQGGHALLHPALGTACALLARRAPFTLDDKGQPLRRLQQQKSA